MTLPRAHCKPKARPITADRVVGELSMCIAPQEQVNSILIGSDHADKTRGASSL